MAEVRLLWTATIAAMAATAFSPSTALAAVGAPQAGRALFTGARPMANGGAPCGACHSIGALGGGSLGPDLSSSFEGMPSEAIDGLLQDLPFPTMAPIYAGHALTATERGQLAAFLAGSTGAPASRGGRRIALHAVALAAVGFAVLGVLGRRRKRPSRPRLRAGAPYSGSMAPPRRRAAVGTEEADARRARAAGGAR